MIVLYSILALILIIHIAISVGLAIHVARPHVISIPDEIEYEKKHGLWKDFDKLTVSDFTVISFDGYEIKGHFVPANGLSNRYVIISHGYTGCHLGSVKYLHMFRDFGYNCIIYDDRGHGNNMRTAVTMGFKESRDLCTVIDYVYNRFGNDIYLGLHGESMGAGLTINALQYRPNIRFIINDCGYCNLEKLLRGILTNSLHLPGYLIKTASLANKLLYGYFYHQVMPIANLADNTIPICFIHGADDDFVPPSHSIALNDEMDRAGLAYHELHLMPKAGHAYSIISDESAYRQIVQDFLKKVK